MTRLQTAYVWLAIFVACVFTCGVATGLLLHDYLMPPSGGRPAGELVDGTAPRPSLSRLSARLAGELDLSPEQREALDRILEARRGALRALRADIRERLMAEITETALQTERILTPAQRPRLHQIVSEVRVRLQQPENAGHAEP